MKVVGLLLLFLSVANFSKATQKTTNLNEKIIQEKSTVSGIVSDKQGPIIGATVMVKNSNNAAVTDQNGSYTLKNLKQGDVIQVSYIGYLTKEVSYNNQGTINFVLEEDAELLNEVVVVGYGTQTKKNLTGAVEQVSGDVLENRPIANIGQGLQGVIPNLNINVNGGAPGQSASFNIRGTTSLNGGSPLVLVDNVQMDPNLVNPDDVESISVLKDASSAAIYGARAAYGVILITTKNGRKGQRPQVSFSASGYWQSPAIRVTNINSIEFLKMKDLAYQAGGGSGHYYNEAIYKYAEAYYNGTYEYPEFYDERIDPNKWQYCGNTDWFKELYKTSFSQMYNINLNGGTERTTYYASFGFNDVNGLLKAGNDYYKKFNANLNVSSDITKWLNLSGKITHTYTKENHPTGGTTTMNPTAYSGLSSYAGMMKGDLSPLMPIRHGHTGRLYNSPGAAGINQSDIYTTGGKVYQDDGIHYYAGQGGYTNPVAIQEQGGDGLYKINDLWMTGAARITPLEGLVFNADYTFNVYNKGEKQHVQKFYDYTAVAGTENYYPWTNPSSVTMRNFEDYYVALNVFGEYTKSIKDTHNFKVMVGYNQEYKHTKNFWAGRKDLIVNTNPAMNLATGDRNLGYGESHWAINGLFARINYNYKHRYLVEFNGRYDGSSKFSKDGRYAFFPSFSAAWRVSEEPFFESIKHWANDLKIRGSWGKLGNQVVGNLGNFPYLPNYGVNTNYNYLLGGAKPVAVTPSGLVSGAFTWETVSQINVGLDAMFLNNRLKASFDWYKRDTKDMLTAGQTLPSVLGTNVPVENAADLKTYGWELSLGWTDVTSSNFSYWVKGVISDYQSEITRFSNDVGSIGNYYIGRKIGEIWGYRSNGLFQTEEEVANHPSQSKIWGGKWAPGDVKYRDLNGDGKIDWGTNTLDDSGDREIIGNSTARYSYGITAGFMFRGFDFEMFWQGVGKRDVAVGGPNFWGFTNEWQTPLKTALDYWTPENTNAYFPRPNWNNGGNRQTSDRYLQDASYVRLKNITLGYTIPQTILDKAGISKLRVYIQGENLLTFTNLIKAFDPETINNMTYPIQKKVAIGINLTF
jgi:TonB-linked outer membrane protein, SusC/RagA family/TonB-dependent outer membrane receptor, SusC/RagA subfamily, signature region